MEIKLLIDDKPKTFTVPFVKGRMLRRVLEIYKDYDLDNLTPETLDVLIDFVVECFKEKFTRDDFYDGVAANEMTSTIIGFMNYVAGIGQEEKKGPNLQKN